MPPNTGAEGFLFAGTSNADSEKNRESSIQEDVTTNIDNNDRLKSTEDSSDEDCEAEQNNEKNPNYRPLGPVEVTASLGVVSAALYMFEKGRQRRLTQTPVVMGQIPPNSLMHSIYDQLTVSPRSRIRKKEFSRDGILKRPIVPSLFIGTNGDLATAVAYLSHGPSSGSTVLRFPEPITSSLDGATIDLVWEVPNYKNSEEGLIRKREILDSTNHRKNPAAARIRHPTILILHGINNSSDFGYMKSLQRTMTIRGWNAAAINFRGCGSTAMTTPRSYTASYTGDLRSVVRQIASRMEPNAPIFLVGNSLGASLLTKYLGEEGLAGTLPTAIKGAVSLGNPFVLRADHIRFPVGGVMGGARKVNYLRHRTTIREVSGSNNEDVGYQTIRSALYDPCTITLESLDRAMAPYMVRNAVHPPYETRFGYGHSSYDGTIPNTWKLLPETTDGKTTPSASDAYWMDSSSFRQGRHVSIPLLHIQAKDDALCFANGRRYLHYALQNPYVLFVETECGGHLGWWEASNKGPRSWAQTATADFFQAILNSTSSGSKLSAKNTTMEIDDPVSAFRINRMKKVDSHAKAEGTASMRCLSGDGASLGNTTILTNDEWQKHSAAPSTVYLQVQEYLLSSQTGQQDITATRLEKNRILEQQESVSFSLRLRSKL